MGNITKKLIGEELIEKGLITQKQLKHALAEQKKLSGDNKERLGEVILKCKFIKEELMVSFLEKHLRVPYMSLREREHVDINALSLIPERMARNLKLIAVSIDNSTLHIVMENPSDIIALDTVRTKTGCRVEKWFSRPVEIEEAINKFYNEENFKKALSIATPLKAKEPPRTIKTQGTKPEYEKLELAATKGPIIELVNKLLLNAIKQRASDIHVEPHEKKLSVRYRIDGILHEATPLPKEKESAVLTRMKLLGSMDIAEHRLPQDGRFVFNVGKKEIDVRMASSPTKFGEKLVLRILDKTNIFLEMEELGLGQEDIKNYKHILNQPYGLVLVTGPTGSGKTTTLYSALNYVNKPSKNIVTIEDPIEYQLEGANQIQIKPLIGLTFASSLRTVLRQDPDIIMIGEIRDLETLENAVKASLTGHLVLSTIHTNDAPGVIYRLIHMGLEPYLIAACLNLVVAQRLIRRICPDCKEKIKLASTIIKGLEKRLDIDLKDISFYKGKGCKACNNTGYKGRVGIFEIFMLNDEIKEMILEGTTEKKLKDTARKMGMKSLLASGIEKVSKGLTTIEEVLKVTFTEKAV